MLLSKLILEDISFVCDKCAIVATDDPAPLSVFSVTLYLNV